MSMLLGQITGRVSPAVLSAVFEDIGTSIGVPATNPNRTITYAGVTRQFMVTHGLAGTLEYRVNSGSYTSCPTGTTFNVPSGQTLNFRINAETGTDLVAGVTITDVTRSEVLDTFACNDFVP